MVKGSIYKIISSKTNNIYIGSTFKNIEVRKEQHKNNFLSYLNGNIKKYCSSYQLLKYEDEKIILLEEIENITKKELQKKEQEYINNEKNVVNISLNNFGIKKQQEEEKNKNNKNILELKELNDKIKLEKKIVREKNILKQFENKNEKIKKSINKKKEDIKKIEEEKNTYEKMIKNLLLFLNNILIISNDKKDTIKIKYLFNKIKENNIYVNLKKEQKRKINYNKFLILLNENEIYKNHLDHDNNKIYILKNIKYKA
jgi:exonuclease SbcC